MSLLRFWPTESNSLECIKPEAENPSDAVFLAVHQDMRFIRKSFQTEQAEDKSQKQLLNEFLRDEPSGAVVMPILGESGIGKSHLVRWLDVQLRQRDDRDKRHVIRIPKSSSLKSVLGRILDGLEGPRYEEIRGQLKAAREQLDDIGAKERIRGDILAVIKRNWIAASKRKEKLKESGGNLSKEDQLWLGHGDDRALPALLKDPATEVMFMQGTSTRPGIISELARHITKDSYGQEAPRRQFEKADFLIPDELGNDIKEAGTIAGRYLEKLQRTTSSKLLDEVVHLLNSIVDDAIALLALPSDTALAELFLEVRRQLLIDGRELVLLVEDFAVLAGVQRALLDAIIRHGVTGGRTEACTIRTALAVTDGYFGNLETVKTRAVHGWWIAAGDYGDEDAIKNQIGNFVAAYVNAARIGAKNLESYYKKSSNIGKKAPNAMEFLAPEIQEQSLLGSFGQSVDGYSMFPFNQTAICTIADWRLRDQQGRLRFHPRSVINEIILPLVKDSRNNYERSAFPPENFLGFPKTRISTDMSTEIARIESNPTRREQYLYLLHFWAGQPQKLSEARLPAGVYHAFGLSVLDGSEATVEPEQLKPLSSFENEKEPEVKKSNAAEPTVEREPLPVRQFVEKLEKWKGGDILGQAEANKIRGWINTHLLYSINWEAELLRQVKPATNTYATSIYLPRAKGNPPNIEKAFVVVATDEQFEDDSFANPIFLATRAMLRYEHYNGWNYEQSDEDYIAISNFLDSHLVDASKWIQGKYKNADGSPIASLTQALLWQARQLNIDTAHKVDDASQLEAVFAAAPEKGVIDEDSEWNTFIDELRTNRIQLREELLERVGAFQGAGKTPHAIDAARILDVVQSFRKSWEVTERFLQTSGGVSDEIKEIDRHISLLGRLGNSRIEARRKYISDQSKLIVAELGKNYDKNALLKDLLEVCALSEQHGLKGEVSVVEVRKLIEKFKDARAKEVSEQVEAIVTGEDIAAHMTALAKLDIQTHALLVEFSATCSKFLHERAGKAQGKILTWTTEVVETKKSEVDRILKELEEAVTPFAKGNE